MTKHNNMVPNGHFHKKWQGYVKMWFSQPAQKVKRRKIREEKAIRKAPRPINGPLRPIVQCQSFRYNSKCRLGRGFTFQELQVVNLNRKFARSIGIAVDHRRRNSSYECVMKNKQRLQEYMNRLILFPINHHKLKMYESNKEECNKAFQLDGPLMPIPIPKKRTKCLKLDIFKDAPSAYKTLKDAKKSLKKNKNKKKKFKCGDDDK